MAESQSSAKPKRRLKTPTQTVRERQTNAQDKNTGAASRWSRVLGPLGWPFRRIAAFGFWQSKAWMPFRKVGHVLGLILLPPYVRNSFRELRRVTWPNWRQSWRLTFAVLGFSIAFGVVIALVDLGLDKLFREVLIK